MAEISFRGKEMSRHEAKSLLNKLKSGIIVLNLNDAEKKHYEELKNLDTNKTIVKSCKSEREYLIRELTLSIKLYELFLVREYCQKHGHKEVKGSASISSRFGSTSYMTAYAWCSRCGEHYERSPTFMERKSFNDMMKEEVTI